ncbi:hypothetical protein AgCh_035762 [Apium graveolens]
MSITSRLRPIKELNEDKSEYQDEDDDDYFYEDIDAYTSGDEEGVSNFDDDCRQNEAICNKDTCCLEVYVFRSFLLFSSLTF